MELTLSRRMIFSEMHPETRQVLKRYLTMPNPKYTEAEKMNRYTGNIDRELKFYQDTPHGLECPRGCAARLCSLCEGMGEEIKIIDIRRTHPPVNFNFAGKLRPLQRKAVKDVLCRDSGLLEAGTGAGKTVMALYIIAERKQPSLIVVHTKELLKQWLSRIETFLGIPRNKVGVIGGGKFSIGERVTVATVQTLYKRVDEVAPYIGHLVVDECHRAPSRIFTEAVTAFDASQYRLGLTATPWRRDKLSKVIFWTMGDIVGKIDKQDLVEAGNLCQAEVKWVKTEFNSKTDASAYYSRILSELTEDEDRNTLIAQTIARNNNHGINLILSDRKKHCEKLKTILRDHHEIQAQVLTGSTSMKNRKQIIYKLQQNQCHHLIATGQLIVSLR